LCHLLPQVVGLRKDCQRLSVELAAAAADAVAAAKERDEQIVAASELRTIVAGLRAKLDEARGDVTVAETGAPVVAGKIPPGGGSGLQVRAVGLLVGCRHWFHFISRWLRLAVLCLNFAPFPRQPLLAQERRSDFLTYWAPSLTKHSA
jgi:hypothetical protein